MNQRTIHKSSYMEAVEIIIILCRLMGHFLSVPSNHDFDSIEEAQGLQVTLNIYNMQGEKESLTKTIKMTLFEVVKIS